MPAALRHREPTNAVSVPSALERLRGALESLSPATDHVDPAALDALLTRQLHSARELGRARDETAAVTAAARSEPLVTAVPALDELLAGGLPRGQMIEMVGARSSGRFSAVLAALAAVTRAGEAAALVDLGDGLDPQVAVTMGVDVSRLLWLRPMGLKQALAATEILLGGGFPMVALDLGSPPVRGGRGGEAAWLRLARAAQAQGAALLIASPYRISGIAAAAVLQAGRGQALWLGEPGRREKDAGRRERQQRDGEAGWAAPAAGPAAAPWLLGGLTSQVAIEKHRGRLLPAERRRELQLRLPETVPCSTTSTVPLPALSPLPGSVPAAAPLAPAVSGPRRAAPRAAAMPLTAGMPPGVVRRAARSARRCAAAGA